MDAPNQPIPPSPPVLPYASPAVGQGTARAPVTALVPAPVLTAEHLAEIAAARKLSAGLRRAVSVGQIDGWSIGIFGVITLLTSIGSMPGMVLGAGMTVLAIFQLKAAARLSMLDENAPRLLARNQIILGILLLLYGTISLVLVINDPAPLSSSAGSTDPEMAHMLAPYDEMASTLYMALYVGVMALAIIGPGLTALYYNRQRKRIIAYRAATPPWLLSLQEAGVRI